MTAPTALAENFERILLTEASRQRVRGTLSWQKLADDAHKAFDASTDAVMASAARHIRASVRDAAEQLSQTGWEPVPGDAAAQSQILILQIVDLEKWQDDLDKEVLPTMAAVFASGAVAELEMLRGLIPEEKTTAQEIAAELDIPIPEGISLGDLPEWVLRAAREAAAEVFSQDYWTKIPQTTRNDIRSVIETGIAEGFSMRKVAGSIIGMLDGQGRAYDRHRALNIARTESGHLLNAGHLASIQNVEEETGLSIGKTWISVLGTTTRDSHAALSGVTVARTEDFDLNGVQVPHPSHWKLPAGDRAN